jgi:hypothetical protein
MTSLTQLIQESIPEVKPDVKYVLRPGEINGLVMVVAVNSDVIPDADEVLDTLARFSRLASAEKLALAKRIAEIASESQYKVGYHVISGPLVNIWVSDKETKEIIIDVIENYVNGRMVARVGDVVMAVDLNDMPPRKSDVCKESDL